MTDPLYREIILEHWKNPQNYGVIEDAEIDISDSNPLCGDEIRITIKISKKNKISDIKFTSQGCAISKASASIFTEMVKGQKIAEVKKLKSEDLLTELGVELTPARLKCAMLVFSALKNSYHFLTPYESNS